jgi:hypothetical protein
MARPPARSVGRLRSSYATLFWQRHGVEQGPEQLGMARELVRFERLLKRI